MPATVRFWDGNDGHETPEAFLTRLRQGNEVERRAFARFVAHLELLAESGRRLGPPAVVLRSATASLYELGSQSGAGQPRLLFCWVGGEALVLHAFIQRGLDMDSADLRLALSRIYGESPTWDCLFLPLSARR